MHIAGFALIYIIIGIISFLIAHAFNQKEINGFTWFIQIVTLWLIVPVYSIVNIIHDIFTKEVE